MKFRPSPVMLSLALALAYSGALALLVDSGCPTEGLHTSNTSAAKRSVEVQAALAPAQASALRMRMTLPFVPRTQVRAEELQEI